MAKQSEKANFLDKALMSERKVDFETAIHDLMGLVFAAMDLPAKLLSQILLRMKRNPEFYDKISAEMDEHFPKIEESPEKLRELLTKPSLDAMEYLHMFMKECLRFEGPSFESLGYKTKEDITLKDGIFLPKGAEFYFGLHYWHNDPKEWVNPEEFIPERFDPESSLFKTPAGAPRHKMSF